MRRALFPLALAAVVVLAVPSSARPLAQRGSYQLQLKPNPAFYATDGLDGRCSPWAYLGHVVGVPESESYHAFRFAHAGVLRATLLPELATFPVGPEWDLVIPGPHGVTAAPRGGAYELAYPVAAGQKVVLVACNKSGWPNATVSWQFTPR